MKLQYIGITGQVQLHNEIKTLITNEIIDIEEQESEFYQTNPLFMTDEQKESCTEKLEQIRIKIKQGKIKSAPLLLGENR